MDRRIQDQERRRGAVEGERLGVRPCTVEGELEIGECRTDPRVERGEGDDDGPKRLGLGKYLDLGGNIVRDSDFGDDGVI
jgi:hypothetical protein